jgi:hypothetical protein
LFALLSLALFACDKGIREEAIDAENILGRWRAVEEPDYDWDDSDDDGACDVPKIFSASIASSRMPLSHAKSANESKANNVTRHR